MDFPTETGIEISDDSNSFEEITADHSGSSSPVTPKTQRIPVVLLTFGSGSSDDDDVTPNHDSDSSFSELDSEAEAFYSSLNHHLVSSPGTIMDGHEFSDKQFRYGELMMKYVQCEEELRTTTLQLQDSEQEVERLKGEAEKRESAENLRAELATARREIETIETEKRQALELQMQVFDMESQLSDSALKFENLVSELEVSKGCLAVSDAEISKLGEMLEKKAFLEAQVRETESRREVLEDLIKRSGSENMEMKSREVKLEAEISALKTDLASRDECIEALIKGFDMLMAEKDEVCAEVDNLKAEMRARDIQIKQMEEKLNQLVFRETELVSESGNARSIVEELRARVKELEKQAEQQRNELSEGEEEKREAIRQLCFSLDHYKNGYRQLLWFLSNK